MLAEVERARVQEAAWVRAAAHRAVDTIARTPLLLVEHDGRYMVVPRDDPEHLVAGIDLSSADIQRRLAAQHVAQRKALVQVRAYIDKHGHDALFDDARIGRSAWMRGAIEQWRSSPLLTREEHARREAAATHRLLLTERQRRWRAQEDEEIGAFVEDGRISLLPETVTAPETGSAKTGLSVSLGVTEPVTNEHDAAEQDAAISVAQSAQPSTPQPVALDDDVWPRWRAGALQPISAAAIGKWRAAGKASFATDIAAFDHVLAARPERTAITDWPLGDALKADAVWLSDPIVHQRLTAIWLYQQMTREDLIAARRQAHIILDPTPAIDPADALSYTNVMADRARHAGDQRLVAMFESIDLGEVVSPPASSRVNRLARTALAAIRTGEEPTVCRLLADAAIAQPAWRKVADGQILDRDVQMIWSASSLPARGVHRRGKATRHHSRYSPRTPPRQPGRS